MLCLSCHIGCTSIEFLAHSVTVLRRLTQWLYKSDLVNHITMAALDITVTLFAYLTLLTKDFQGMSEIFSNFQGLSKTFKDFKDFQRLQVLSRSLRNFRDFQGLLRTLRDFQVPTRTSKRLSRISKDPQEPSGTPQDLKDFKIPSKTSGTIPLLVTSIQAVLWDLWRDITLVVRTWRSCDVTSECVDVLCAATFWARHGQKRRP